MKKSGLGTVLGLFAGLSLVTGSALAQVETIDPNDAIDADLATQSEDTQDPANDAASPYEENVTVGPAAETQESKGMPESSDVSTETPETLPSDPDYSATADPSDPSQQIEDKDTYQKDDLIGAAEGVFGKGAEGLAMMIEDILKKQGEPNGYIVGREAGGAFIVGLRYGSGTLYHKVEGEQKVYWTGPSVGFDAGANAANSFTLVYNLYDTNDLYKRYGAGEGSAYLLGGFTASYLRRGDVVLIPVRLGVGVRLGANVGYRKFSKKQRWLPF